MYNIEYKMFLPLVAEYFATFLFIMSILATGNAFVIGGTLAVLIYLLGNVSGCHVNPAVSFAMFLKGAISSTDFMSYVAVQLAGSGSAWYAYQVLL